MQTEIEEIDVVVPKADVPGTSIKAGTQGTVVIVADDGALLVEFADCFGVTVAEVWLRPADVQRVWSSRTGQFVNAGELVAA